MHLTRHMPVPCIGVDSLVQHLVIAVLADILTLTVLRPPVGTLLTTDLGIASFEISKFLRFR